MSQEIEIDEELLDQSKIALMEMGLTEDEAEREVEDYYNQY
jgi:antitoxin component of RelBE/YafQ-DinJ toxin-antitoxin module